DRDLVGDVLEHPALLDARGLLHAEELDRDLGLDLLVQLDLEQVEVEQAPPHRIALLLLDDHGRGLAAVELEVEQRPAARQHRPGVALGHLEGLSLAAAAVYDAGNQARAAQPTARAGAELAALLDPQCRAVRGHGRPRSIASRLICKPIAPAAIRNRPLEPLHACIRSFGTSAARGYPDAMPDDKIPKGRIRRSAKLGSTRSTWASRWTSSSRSSSTRRSRPHRSGRCTAPRSTTGVPSRSRSSTRGSPRRSNQTCATRG